MARIRDFVPAIRSVGIRTFVFKLIGEVARDRLTAQAAAVAYAWLFAMFPFLLFLLTLFAYIPERQKVEPRKLIAETINSVMAHDAAETILKNLDEVLNEPRSGLLSIGLIVTLWVASGGMSMTMTALDTAYDDRRPWPFYTQRPLAMLLTIVVTVLIMIVFILLPIGTSLERWLADKNIIPPQILWLITSTRYIIAILLMQAVLTLLYTYGTRIRRKIVFFSPGAIFTMLVWIILGAAFRFYVDRFGSYQKTYGAIGGVTIVLLFFYLDALVLLIGAEINNQIDEMRQPDVHTAAKPTVASSH